MSTKTSRHNVNTSTSRDGLTGRQQVAVQCTQCTTLLK